MQELDRAGQAKAAMFPADHPTGSSRDPQDPSHHLYVTSHGAYAAGEQRDRHYDWDSAHVNPATHSFGESCLAVHASPESMIVSCKSPLVWLLCPLPMLHEFVCSTWNHQDGDVLSTRCLTVQLCVTAGLASGSDRQGGELYSDP